MRNQKFEYKGKKGETIIQIPISISELITNKFHVHVPLILLSQEIGK